MQEGPNDACIEKFLAEIKGLRLKLRNRFHSKPRTDRLQLIQLFRHSQGVRHSQRPI